jgi:hypothetical protein
MFKLIMFLLWNVMILANGLMFLFGVIMIGNNEILGVLMLGIYSGLSYWGFAP